jgi:uncharacterized protein (TIGR02001 family)
MVMGGTRLAAASAVAALAFASGARAQDKVDVAFNVGAATDYEFRGVSQTDHDPQVFGGVDLTSGQLYAGTWLSNVDFGNDTDVEFDLYAGVKPTAGPVSLDFAILYYGYAGQPSGSHEDYFEGKAAASIPLGPATLGAALFYSPEFFGKTGNALYYEANASVGIPRTSFSISGALGRQEVEGPSDYTTWNIGVGYALNQHLGLDVRYSDTDEHRFGKIYDSRLTASMKVAW